MPPTPVRAIYVEEAPVAVEEAPAAAEEAPAAVTFDGCIGISCVNGMVVYPNIFEDRNINTTHYTTVGQESKGALFTRKWKGGTSDKKA